MKSLTRFLTLALALSLAATMLFACGKQKKQSERGENNDAPAVTSDIIDISANPPEEDDGNWSTPIK